jgi:hypothetical protein
MLLQTCCSENKSFGKLPVSFPDWWGRSLYTTIIRIPEDLGMISVPILITPMLKKKKKKEDTTVGFS